MEAHQVPGVAQLPAGRIRGVVRVEEKTILIGHGAAGGTAAGKGEATGDVARCVHVRQELIYSLIYVVCLTESADDAGFLQRVLLAAGFGRQRFLIPRVDGPLAAIAPVGILSQDAVRIQQRRVGMFTDILAVAAAAGPVHEPGRFERRPVGPFHADPRRQHAADRLVFVRGDGACQRQQHPQARG